MYPVTWANTSLDEGGGSPAFAGFLRHNTLRDADTATSAAYRQGAEVNLTLRGGVGGGT